METASGPSSVRQHLYRFAIATISVGVGLFTLAWPTEAEIVYTPVNITIGENSSYNLDLNNDGVTDFVISASQSPAPCGPQGFQSPYDTVAETPASGNGAEGSPPARLKKREQIGPNQTFYGGAGTMAWVFFCEYGSGGDSWIYESPGYIVGRKGYLGLMFQTNGETHYGWALLGVKLRFAKDDVIVSLRGYAYETVPGKPIYAGQTQ